MQYTTILGNTGYLSVGNAMVPVYRLSDQEVVLIDSGPVRSPGMIALLKQNHWKVRAVIHTHLHIDHVMNGAALILENPDIVFYATEEETAAHRTPEEVLYAYGGENIQDIGEFMWLTSDRMRTVRYEGIDYESVSIDGHTFKMISMPGHSEGHAAVVTPDGVCCLGDAIISREVLRVSKLPYMDHVGKNFEAIHAIKKMQYSHYIVAHQSIETDETIMKLVEENLVKEEELCRIAYGMIRKPMEKEYAIDQYMKELHIREMVGWERRVVRFTAWQRYQYLIERGKLRLENGRLYREPSVQNYNS